MKKVIPLALVLALVLCACAPAAPTIYATPSPEPTAVATPEPTPEPTPTPTPEPTPYPFGTIVPASAEVDDDYFDDAAIVGDSRTDGLKLYGGMKTATFLAATSLSVFNIGKKTVKYNGANSLVLDALKAGNFGKVYLSLGINELGWQDDQGYHDCYADLVDSIRAAAPDAVIYLQLLIPVNTQKCADKKIGSHINNAQIAVYNDLITQIAAEKQVLLLDPAEVFIDETGEPPYDSTGDGVHFNRDGYTLWRDYLKTHTVAKESFT